VAGGGAVRVKPITFIAALADGRTCLGCDRDGEWRLMLILPSDEGKKLAQRIDELRDVSFGVALQPVKSDLDAA
jgi:hypothetical protein